MFITFWVGCTPLHWSTLRGNVEACSVLAHAGSKEELVVKDKAGKTPVELASDKGHRHITLLLVCNFIGNYHFKITFIALIVGTTAFFFKDFLMF